jgi:hypothetical protein
MSGDASQSFANVIEEHLELKRRNAALDGEMPLDKYEVDDPFENHPLFKSEEQARIEETAGGTEPMSPDEELVLAWPVEEAETTERAQPEPEDTIWGRQSREFDWGE